MRFFQATYLFSAASEYARSLIQRRLLSMKFAIKKFSKSGCLANFSKNILSFLLSNDEDFSFALPWNLT